MAAIVRAAGQVPDGAEIDFLLRVVIESPSQVVRAAARDALNERLTEGVDVATTGTDRRPPTTTIDWAQLAAVGPRPRLVLDTDRGRVVLELDTESAPQTVQRIVTTAASGRYDGVPFHRVVSNFVVQGGDYVREDGYGGPETPVRSELTRLRFGTGVVGMASSGKDTEGLAVLRHAQPAAAPRRPLHRVRPRRGGPGRGGPDRPGRRGPPRPRRAVGRVSPAATPR